MYVGSFPSTNNAINVVVSLVFQYRINATTVLVEYNST